MFFNDTKAARLDALDRSQAVIEFALDGTILNANANFLSTMGYDLPEIKGRHHSMFVDPTERGGATYEAFWATLSRGEFQTGEYRRFAKGGREVWIQATYNPVLDRTGRPMRVIKFATDITAQKLQSVADGAKVSAIHRSQAVIQFKLDGTILTANENFLRTVGYGLDEISGQHHRMFVDPADRESAAYREFWTALAHGEFRGGEYKRLGKRGREIWLQATYNPVLDPAGRPVGVVKFAVDITSDKLRNLDLNGQVAAINKSQGVIHFALDGTILDANDNFLAATGYRLNEVQGQHHRMFVDAGYAASLEYRQFWEHLRSGRFHAANYKRLGKGGQEVWIQATYNPVLGADGQPLKVVKYCVDITASMTARLRALAAAGQIQGNIQASATAAEELSASVAEIAQSAARSRTLISSMSAQTRAGDRSTSELEQAAASMTRIVQVIQGVGEQINLLALNATIEAARAGEAGRGFAVVAGEVKTLAGQVTRATEQITGDIQAMQAVSGTVVEALRAIERSVTEVQGVVGGIAAAVEEQSAVTQEMSSSMQSVSQGLAEVNASLSALAL